MRVLLGGLIGAAVSSAAWFGLEYAIARELGWLAIAVGIVTGMCVNAAAGAGAAESYGRAALAVILTMVALIGGRLAYAQIMRSASQVTTVVADKAVADKPAEEAKESDGEAVAVMPGQADRAAFESDGPPRMMLQKPKVTSMSEFDMLWMGLAALMAYFFGKGSGKPAPIVTDTDTTMPEGAAPA